MQASPLHKRIPTLVLGGLGIILVAAVATGIATLPPTAYGDLDLDQQIPYLVCVGCAGIAYAIAVWRVRYRTAPRGAVAIILVAGVVARLLVLCVPPALSTDLYRYVWDGRVQAAGINPYRYIPADPALTVLRDPPHTGPLPAPIAIYPNINRADTAPTIYPPAAQALFALVGQVAPGIWGIKAAMLLFDLITAGLALLILRAAARPAAHVLIWAWNPLVIWEFAGAGHIDAMAIAFTALALLLAIRAGPPGNQGWAGLALGIAIATKFLPAVFFPAIWRRWDWRSPLAAAAVLVAGYAAYSSVGLRVLGFLGGYTQEERLQEGGGFLLLRLLALAGPLPAWAGRAYLAAGLVLLAAIAVAVMRQPLPAAPAARATVIGNAALMLAAALVVVLSPHYPWYLTMLVLPAMLRPTWSVLYLTLTAPLLYRDFGLHRVDWAAAAFLPAIPLVFIDLRRRTPTPALPAKGGH